MGEVKRLRIIAGPNGSGKTSLYWDLRKKGHPQLGIYLNPDIIEETLKTKGVISFSDFSVEFLDDELCGSFRSFLKDRKSAVSEQDFRVDDNFLVILNRGAVDSYFAAFVVEQIRDKMLSVGIPTITIETVMSHKSKLEMIARARELGYRVYLYYISTSSPMINQERVKARTKLGGHDVPADKLLSRYDRSLDLLYDAIKMSDRAFLIDNSTKIQEVVAEYERETNSMRLYSEDCPDWVARYFFDKDS